MVKNLPYRLALLLVLIVSYGFASPGVVPSKKTTSAKPLAACPLFTSEIHYQNIGADVGERIEIAGTAGTSMTGWSVIFYDGSNGQTYATVNLSGTLSAANNCNNLGFTVIDVLAATGFAFQNGTAGSPDGWALVNNGAVVEFFSYGGVFTATNGTANGMTSTNIGIIEPTDAPAGSSVRRTAVNTWVYDAGTNTFGDCNTNQYTPLCSSTPSVNLSVSTSQGAEISGTTITVTANSTAAVSGNQTVTLAVTGANLTSGDYTLTNTTITIPNGTTSGSVTFTIQNDALVEGTETATLTISSPSSGISLGITTAQNITVHDNDLADPNGLPIFSNEIHYDNTGVDANEKIEIAGNAGTSLTGWSIVFYDGSTGTPYATVNLTGTLPTSCTQSGRSIGVTVVDVLTATGFAFQNEIDGWALCLNGTVVEFLSYENTFAAVSGAAMGRTSVSIGALEDGTGASSGSIQRTGISNWVTNASTNTFGACNSTQFIPCVSFSGAPSNVTVTNSTCNGSCTPAGGVITAPAGSPCPTGSTLQYQVNGGTWTTTLPTYAQSGPAQSIKTRCNCNTDNTKSSAESATVTTVPGTCTSPGVFTVTGGGIYCESAMTGVAVGLSGSQTGTNYQLKNGAANVGDAKAGTGSAIGFGNQLTAGTYTVVATRTGTNCTAVMTGSAVVTVIPATLKITTHITSGPVLQRGSQCTANNKISNANVEYRGVQSITLQQGFQATGNTFLARIGGCN